MNTNFNIVKKPKKEDVEIEEDEEEIELDDDDDKPSKSSSNDLRKRMFLVMGFIVGGTILLLFILYLCSLLMHKTYDYADIENLMESSAKKYFKDNPNYLPTEEGNIVELDVNNLVAGSYMKNLSEYTGEGVTCSGTIQVEKSGSEYLYTPYLNCGDQYYTEELYKKIVNDNNVVTSGYGLYSHNGSYAYRGEEVNNYVKLDNSLWRIVKVTSNNNVVLIHNDGLPYTQPWDDRYNESRFYAAGINSYGASRIKEYLNKVYKNSKTKKEDEKGVDRQVIPYLTAEEVEAGAAAGKVGFGRIYSEKKPDLEREQENALQCFTDGLVRVFQNETELTELDGKMELKAGDTFTLIRFTFLAGRLW